LSPVDRGHRYAAEPETFFDGRQQFRVLAKGPSGDFGGNFSREIVVGRAKSAGRNHERRALERGAEHGFEIGTSIRHDRFRVDRDAEVG
jgi:hypothetical protein